ncbi:MAG: NAD(P)-dependent dehydrogenase (short-subunit alcohol dehydrogenase family) [Paracoccaceae bacterium]|jgi:NAD(P)-dependent dehydrogenase (short-subunit alcohol dehydrogenase family)
MQTDKVVLVTGSASGIGFAIAKKCHAQGAKVVLHGLDAGELETAAQKLGADVSYIVADLIDPAAPQKIVDFVIEKHGRIDSLVNNAARLDRCTLKTATSDLVDAMFAVNFRAPLMLIQAATAVMEQQGGGSIVNIGSINASCGAPTLLVYSATKGALATITRNLGFALGPKGVRINQIDVGWTATENEHRIQTTEGRPENWHELVHESYTPSGALLTADQIAEHAVFWLSDQSAPITGQVYEVEQYPMIGRAFHISPAKTPTT